MSDASGPSLTERLARGAADPFEKALVEHIMKEVTVDIRVRYRATPLAVPPLPNLPYPGHFPWTADPAAWENYWQFYARHVERQLRAEEFVGHDPLPLPDDVSEAMVHVLVKYLRAGLQAETAAIKREVVTRAAEIALRRARALTGQP
jgi:hypothetical protein